ncbi:hypothetical protein RAS12_16105 [Achromobacter seleniivolatilans]|uniref:Uncharacterized protein n=1 Tax=Achromobacter seleniivolatilans TaxID=3047478 RepID=A0ABY9LTT5_9BURK|nr:hypothetical protein [Achromobacter sp. R39]WMD18176.1 hypothetical protein RAS12_16105 [Achromobacter sp. R39]
MTTCHADLADTLRSPVTKPDDLDPLEQFFQRPEVSAFYAHAQEPGQDNPSLVFCAELLPALHPNRASALALMCGSLVEDDADPAILFPTLQTLLRVWLHTLRPYCAQEVEEDDEEVEEADRQVWIDAQGKMAALPQDKRWEIEALQEAVDVLVLPMMTMLMRDQGNHQGFVSDQELMALLHPMATNNDSLPFEQLHYLWMAAQVSYEHELVVVLPTSKTGFVADAHAINNTFHAFTLLQIMIGEHAQALGVKREIAQREPDMDGDTADFQWLQIGAYANGELVNAMLWAWGEAALRHNMSKHGKRVLIALETDEGTKRNWSGFNGIIHAAQQPAMTFRRYLTPEEVTSYLT